MLLSGLLSLMAIASLGFRGLNFGVDFTGGLLLEVGYGAPVDLQAVRSQLADAGYADAQVQAFGAKGDVLIRMMPREDATAAQQGDKLLKVLKAADSSVKLRRIEFVGPQVGAKLAEQGAIAMIFATLMILFYVMFRFHWKFALGAIAALVHDVTVTVGLFSVLQLPFDLSVLAAVLAVMGYSLNDTIVVFDRIRENFRLMRRVDAVEVCNTSINETLSRTVVTGLTTLMVLCALYFLGGQTLRGFSLTLIVGIVVGTYSSVYIASAAALALGLNRDDLLVDRKVHEEDGLP
jgi:preprotein translocase subunit SecF